MKITIEPSNVDPNHSSAATQHRVVIEHPDDDLTLDVTIELLEAALKAYGFAGDLTLSYSFPPETLSSISGHRTSDTHAGCDSLD